MLNLHIIEKYKNYIRKNYKEYILAFLLFFIGLFVGVLIINSTKETQIEEINKYITEFIQKFKEIETINKYSLILNSVKNNIKLAAIIWIAGTRVIGIPIVFGMIIYRGLTLGFTVSAITCTLGTYKGILFCIISILIQNIIFIPTILTLGVSSINLYKIITKDRNKETIKLGIAKHTIISLLMILFLIFSSIIENTISLEILKKFIKYF